MVDKKLFYLIYILYVPLKHYYIYELTLKSDKSVINERGKKWAKL